MQDTLELAPGSTFAKMCIQGTVNSKPVGFKRSFASGLAFGGVMPYICAPVAQRSKQTLAATILNASSQAEVLQWPGVDGITTHTELFGHVISSYLRTYIVFDKRSIYWQRAYEK